MNEKIYSLIKERILSLDYKPGQILNEQTLAKELGVSRTPLREVLTRLEWEKLVRILPRTGSMVTEVEFQQMIHIFQIRFEIEELAGRLAAENITQEHLDRIKAIQQECQQLWDKIDLNLLMEIDNKLRAVVYEAAGNPLLTEISNSLRNLTHRLWSLMFERGNWSGEVQAMMDELVLMHDVLAERDPEKAGQARREMLRYNVQRIKSKF